MVKGDRSHPNLVKLDGLQLSYPGWEKDFLAAERAHIAGSGYDIALFVLEESQRIHNGDRSHSRLVKLDSLKLSYPGCEKDRREVERIYHLRNTEQMFADSMFNNAVEGLKNKQRMFQGDRSHPLLRKLDRLKLSYPGWEKDFEAAETEHKEGGTYFGKERLHTLKEKQRIHEGCRSHWRLKKLDSLKLSYPGWQEDVKDAEKYHRVAEERLHTLKEKQSIYEGRRSHWRLKKLDSLKLSYPGWHEDVKDAEHFHVRNKNDDICDYIFETKLQGMKNRQDMFMGDRSHPNLVKLYELNLTYPGWRDDFNDALVAHGKGGIRYPVHLHKLRQKQRLHDGDRSHWRVVEIDSLDLSYPGWQNDINYLKENHLNNDEGDVANDCFKSYVKGFRNKQKMYMGYFNEHQQEEDEADENDASNLGLCVACAARPKSCAFVPCGHVSLCESCSSKSMSTTTRCPICRQPAEKFVKIHVS